MFIDNYICCYEFCLQKSPYLEEKKLTILQNASKFPNKKFGFGPGIPIFSKICIFSFLCLQMKIT